MAKKSQKSGGSAVSSLSFEEALAELEEITRALESGSLSLDESIKAYETGMELRQACAAMLEQAEKKLQVLEQKSSGQVEVQSLDNDAGQGEQAELPRADAEDENQAGLF